MAPRKTGKKTLPQFIRYDFSTFSYHDAVSLSVISQVLSEEYDQTVRDNVLFEDDSELEL